MKKMYLFLAVLITAIFSANAQTDVTSLYISNSNFDSGFDYALATTGNLTTGATSKKALSGWTAAASTNSCAGAFEYGTAATFNGATIPTAGYGSSTGGCFAFSNGWGETVLYTTTNEITLPVGTYKFIYAANNRIAMPMASSRFGFVPTTGTAKYTSRVATSYFALNTWVADTVTFTLTSPTAGKFSMGYVAVAGSGSGSSAKLCVDFVKVVLMPVDKTNLQALLTTATTMANGVHQPVGSSSAYTDLSTAIAAAQTVYDNASATAADVIGQETALTAVITAVNNAITLQSRIDTWTTLPYDATSVIVNPSFETVQLDKQQTIPGWTKTGTANSEYCTRNDAGPAGFKTGNVYFQYWSNANPRPDFSISQIVTNLPNGKYRITAAAGGDAGTTGTYVYAQDKQIQVTSTGNFSVDAVVSDGSLTLGFKSVSRSVNWAFADNFRLYYLSDGSPYIYLEPTSLTFNPTNLTKTFDVSGGYLTGDATLVAPAGITLSKTTLTAAEVEAGVIVTATFDNATVITNGSITITSGSVTKTLTVNTSIDPVVLTSLSSMRYDEVLSTGSFTVTGSNLASDITITAPAGITVNPTSIPKGTGAVNAVAVSVTYDGTTPNVSGNIVVTSGVATKNIAVVAALNSNKYTPLYSTLTNIIADTYCNSLSTYAGWGSNSLVSDYVYSGARSIKVSGKCGGSLDFNLTGKIEGNKTYRVKAMVSTNGTGEAKIGVSGATATIITNTISTAAGEWLPVDFTFTTQPVVSAPNMYLNSCETQTATESYIDNYEMYDITSIATGVNQLGNTKFNTYISGSKLVADFNLDQASAVEFSVYNTQGMLISIQKGNFNSGSNHTVINANLTTGVYIVKIAQNGKIFAQKVIL